MAAYRLFPLGVWIFDMGLDVLVFRAGLPA